MEFCIEVSKEGVSELGELGVEFVTKQFKYLIQHKKIISKLKEEFEELKAWKQWLQGWVNAESIKGNEIPPNVSKFDVELLIG